MYKEEAFETEDKCWRENELGHGNNYGEKNVLVRPSTNTTSSNLMHRRLGIGGERHHSYTGHKVTSHMPHTCTHLKQ